jgi:hypothetical protein
LSVDPAIAALALVCTALLFASAAIHKLRDLRRFDEIFNAYGLIPLRARLRLSYAVPVLEALVAVGVSFDVTRQSALLTGMGLLLTYALAIAVNLRRGRRDLACGCGGPDDRRPIAAWMVWRNGLLTLMLGSLLLPWGPRPLASTDLVTIGFGALTCSLVYLCLDRLLDQAARAAARLRVPS